MADWLIGTKGGLFQGAPGGQWSRLGGYEYRITSIARRQGRIFVGAGSGLWEAVPGSAWIQLHDETLTEVLDIAPIDGDPGLVAASAYGVATAARDELGAARWSFWSDGLRVNERFSNAVLVMDQTRWLVGTEGGVVLAADGGKRWEHTDLQGCAVRGLCAAHGAYWAGTDERGIWRSEDGLHWEAAGTGLSDGTVFALAAAGDGLVAGTLNGVVWGDGRGHWQSTGPSMLMAAVGVDPADPELWLAGADPGGLWLTRDGGSTWNQQRDMPAAMEAILPPERR
jgi:hypothetical protein